SRLPDGDEDPRDDEGVRGGEVGAGVDADEGPGGERGQVVGERGGAGRVAGVLEAEGVSEGVASGGDAVVVGVDVERDGLVGEDGEEGLKDIDADDVVDDPGLVAAGAVGDVESLVTGGEGGGEVKLIDVDADDVGEGWRDGVDGA